MLTDALLRLERIVDRAKAGHVTVRSREKSKVTYLCQSAKALGQAGSCQCVVVRCGLCLVYRPRSHHKIRLNRHPWEMPHARERMTGVEALGTAVFGNVCRRPAVDVQQT